jgi:hypothetical protein
MQTAFHLLKSIPKLKYPVITFFPSTNLPFAVAPQETNSTIVTKNKTTERRETIDVPCDYSLTLFFVFRGEIDEKAFAC